MAIIALVGAAGIAMSACSPSRQPPTEVVRGHIYVSGCLSAKVDDQARKCASMALPDVKLTITRSGVVLASGVTDVNGYVELAVNGSGSVTITGISEFINGGSFTDNLNLQGHGTYVLDRTVPIAVGIEPGS